MLINLIAAISKNRGIGIDNKLPFSFKTDMKHFAKLTKNQNNKLNAVIMGRNTWDSLPKYLNKRLNVVITSNPTKLNKIEKKELQKPLTFNNIEDALMCCEMTDIDEVWVIGGESIYKYFLEKDLLDKLYITEINKEYVCDRFFPEIDESVWKVSRVFNFKENNITLSFKEYIKEKHCDDELYVSNNIENTKIEDINNENR
jgi:dihydrofolate reductase